MHIMLTIALSMDHDVICDHIGGGIYILEIGIHVKLEEVLCLIKTKWHLHKAIPSPQRVECHQELGLVIHWKSPKPTVGVNLGNFCNFSDGRSDILESPGIVDVEAKSLVDGSRV